MSVMLLTRSASYDILCPVPGNRLATIDGLGQTHTVPVARPRGHQGRMTLFGEERVRSSPSLVPL